jgi:hypothetical protein
LKKKIFLLGRHSHRTPLSYPVYRKLFSNYLSYVSNIEDADFIVLGFVIDIKDHLNEILSSLAKHPHQTVIVLSEEPLWDTVYSGDYTRKINTYNVDGVEVPFIFLNHVTTNIYDFEKIPYFITTNDDYFIRYSLMFNRNSNLSAGELIKTWSNAIYRYAFYAEKRTGKWHLVENKKLDVYGLCLFRSELTEAINHPGTIKVGKGWENGIIRQELPDWHLDKIVRLDRKTYILSALENTHHPHYITEKILDAFAVRGIPLYFFSDNNRLGELINTNSVINLFGLGIKDALKTIEEFVVSDTFINNYRDSLHQLSALFSSIHPIISERNQIIDMVLQEFHYSIP